MQAATEDPPGTAPALDSPAGALWLFMTGAHASRQDRAGWLDEAEHTYRQILGMLEAQPTSPQQQRHIAAATHNLGLVAQLRGQLGEAQQWYARSLAIEEELGNRPGMATTYHQLGRVAQDRGELGEAQDWYARSLAISEELGNRPGAALTLAALGLLAEERGDLAGALEQMIRCVTQLEPFPHPQTRPGHLARLTARLGISALETAWQK